MKTLILIPALNEEKNIERVIGDVWEVMPKAEILVVNDGSSDQTALVAENTKKATVITLPHNLGIGGAVQTGFKYAEINDYEIVVRLDGDGQHAAAGIGRVMGPVLSGEADIVIGSRFLEKNQPSSLLARRVGQKIIGFFTSVIISQKITDATSGFRCYNKKALDILNKYYPSDFPEPEEIIFLKKNKFRIKEVGVLMRAREGGSSSLTALKSVYYAIKVALAIFISILRTPIIK